MERDEKKLLVYNEGARKLDLKLNCYCLYFFQLCLRNMRKYN